MPPGRHSVHAFPLDAPLALSYADRALLRRIPFGAICDDTGHVILTDEKVPAPLCPVIGGGGRGGLGAVPSIERLVAGMLGGVPSVVGEVVGAMGASDASGTCIPHLRPSTLLPSTARHPSH